MIELSDWNENDTLLKGQIEKTSSLTSYFWPMVPVLSIKNVFVKIKNSIFPPKYTIYGRNVEKQNSFFQRDLQISWRPFFYRSYISCLSMNTVIKYKHFWFLKNLYESRKKFSWQNYSSQEDSPIHFRALFNRTPSFRSNWKNFIKNKTIQFCTKSLRDTKKMSRKKNCFFKFIKFLIQSVALVKNFVVHKSKSP